MARVDWGRLALGGVLIGSAAYVVTRSRVAHATPGRGDRFTPAAAPRYPSGIPMADVQYDAATFGPIVRRLIATEYPRVNEAFAMKWGAIESDWNPCAVGNPGQIESGSGQPAEIGLGQLYNPDDFHAFHQDPAAFRAYAPAAAPIAAAYRQAKSDLAAAQAAHDQVAIGNAKARMNAAARQIQSRTRPLTAQEMDDQVRWTLLAKIQQGILNADRIVATYALGWSVPDYWKLVKAPHALPAILGNGMPAVVKKLGRAPASWHEFRVTLGMEGNDQWVRALDACEACGDAVAPAVA